VTKRSVSGAIVLAAMAIFPACQEVKGQTEPPATPVRVQAVAPAPVPPSLRYSATIEADRIVNIAFQSSGYVDSIMQRRGADGRWRPLQPGDRIDAGAVLARVREADYRGRLDQASSSVREVEAAHAKARLDLDRARALFATASLTKPELDAATAAFDAREAQLAAARAQASIAATALQDTAIVAPFSGVVVTRQIEVGALVNPGLVAFVIARVTPVKAIVGVPDLHVGRLAPGRALQVRSEAAPDAAFAGVILAIAPSANDQNRLFNVEISLPNTDGALRPGMVASVEIPATSAESTAPSGASVPLAAVVRSGVGSSNYGVFVVEGEGVRRTAKAREVELGEVRGNSVVVTRGLRTGETIVVSGPGLLADGDRIRIIP
jgi:RND family efflux transporter MFP subunit